MCGETCKAPAEKATGGGVTAEPANEPIGTDAEAGQFFDALSSAKGGKIAADEWDLTAAPTSIATALGSCESAAQLVW